MTLFVLFPGEKGDLMAKYAQAYLLESDRLRFKPQLRCSLSKP